MPTEKAAEKSFDANTLKPEWLSPRITSLFVDRVPVNGTIIDYITVAKLEGFHAKEVGCKSIHLVAAGYYVEFDDGKAQLVPHYRVLTAELRKAA